MQPSTAAREARRIGDVARHELDAEAREVRAALRPAHERADVASFRAQRMHDPRADEARAARDEDLHDSKFCQ